MQVNQTDELVSQLQGPLDAIAAVLAAGEKSGEPHDQRRDRLSPTLDILRVKQQ